MATEQCVRLVEETLHKSSHDQHLSAGQTQVHKESKDASQLHVHNQLSHDTTKTHAESKTPSHAAHGQPVAQVMAVMKEKKEKEKDKGKKEKKEKDKDKDKKENKEKDKGKDKKEKDKKEKKEKDKDKDKKEKKEKKPDKEKSKHKNKD